MIKHIATAIVLFLAPAAAFAQTGPYIQAEGGLALPDSVTRETVKANFNDGYSVGGAAGYNFGPVAIETGGTYSNSSSKHIKDAKLNANADFDRRIVSGTVSLLGQVHLSKAVTLFGGPGFSYSNVRLRARTGVDCGEVLAIRTVSNDRTPRSGGCTDQGDNSNWNVGYLVTGGLRMSNPGSKFFAGAKYVYSDVLDVNTAYHNRRLRKEGIANKNYADSSIRAFVGVRF